MFLGIGAALSLGAAAHGQLMITDSGNDRVMLFSEADGSLIDANWLTDIGAVGWAFSTPKEARVVGNEIWVSDQIADAIHRFDMDRNYLGSITAHFNAGVNLDNLRGFGADETSVYLAVFTSNTANRGIVVYDHSGNPTGFYQGGGSYFDAEPHMGNLLVTNSSSDDVEIWTGGVMSGTFAADIDFPQQVTVLPDDSVITVASIASAAVEGIYHYNADGSLRLFIPTEPLKMQFGEQVPRGAVLLQDGQYLVATGAGVYKTASTTPPFSFLQMEADSDAQYIVSMEKKGPPICLCNWNGDKALNSQDFFDFLNDFFADNADFNADGVTNSQDFFDFLACFFEGCPG
jgi:hypothetical protein